MKKSNILPYDSLMNIYQGKQSQNIFDDDVTDFL